MLTRWLPFSDKTIKLWKVHERELKTVTSSNMHPESPPVGEPSLRLPKLATQEHAFVHTPRRVFANAHAYHINSISVNSDAETFISADDLRINLWNLNITDQSFNIVDIKPNNMEELTEVITAAEFHPTACNLLVYSSSKGTIKLADMRSQTLCDASAKRTSMLACLYFLLLT